MISKSITPLILSYYINNNPTYINNQQLGIPTNTNNTPYKTINMPPIINLPVSISSPSNTIKHPILPFSVTNS